MKLPVCKQEKGGQERRSRSKKGAGLGLASQPRRQEDKAHGGKKTGDGNCQLRTPCGVPSTTCCFRLCSHDPAREQTSHDGSLDSAEAEPNRYKRYEHFYQKSDNHAYR